MYASIHFLSIFLLQYRHVFKRLKFMGNKLLSQMFTLLFLAVWHGLHSGYLICFSMEFIIVNVEKQVTMATLLYPTWGVKLFRIKMSKVFESLTFIVSDSFLKVYSFEDVVFLSLGSHWEFIWHYKHYRHYRIYLLLYKWRSKTAF